MYKLSPGKGAWYNVELVVSEMENLRLNMIMIMNQILKWK